MCDFPEILFTYAAWVLLTNGNAQVKHGRNANTEPNGGPYTVLPLPLPIRHYSSTSLYKIVASIFVRSKLVIILAKWQIIKPEII